MEGIFIVGSLCLLAYELVKLNKNSAERKMMLQMGVNPNQSAETNKNRTLDFLKWGIVFVGIGFGLLVAELCNQFRCLDKDAAYIAMVLLFGGISFIISHVVVDNQLKKQHKKEDDTSKNE